MAQEAKCSPLVPSLRALRVLRGEEDTSFAIRPRGRRPTERAEGTECLRDRENSAWIGGRTLRGRREPSERSGQSPATGERSPSTRLRPETDPGEVTGSKPRSRKGQVSPRRARRATKDGTPWRRRQKAAPWCLPFVLFVASRSIPTGSQSMPPGPAQIPDHLGTPPCRKILADARVRSYALNKLRTNAPSSTPR